MRASSAESPRWPVGVSAAGDFLSLARWPNALLAATGVVIGARYAGATVTWPVALAALAALPLTAAANAWDDLADVAIDRRAHPHRPLARGAISTRAADRFAWGSAILALLLATAARPALGMLTVGVLAVMRLYSPWLKARGLAGNAVVATVAALPFVYGSWAAGDPRPGLILALLAAPLQLARELAKDIEDAPADCDTRATVPVAYGDRVARAGVAMASALSGFLIVAVLAPHRWALAAALPGLALAAAGGMRAARGVHGSPFVLKLAMVALLFPFAVAPH